MKGIGIKYQLRMTTLIPVLVLALLFAIFYNGQFNKDLERHTSQLGEAYIRQLIPAAQFGLLRDDKRILQGLIDASTVNQEIQAIAFYNSQGQLLAYRGGKHSLKHPFSPPEFTGDFIESKKLNPYTINFLAPITVPKFNLYSFTPFKPPKSPINFQADDVLGWLSIDIDTKATLLKQYQMYIVTMFISLFGLLLSLSIHYLLSKNVYKPIARLRRSMKQILSNEFETKIKTTSKGELGVIEKGCAHLQKQYLNMVHELNQHIEVATADLQKNLELLEEKNIELSLEKKKSDEKLRLKAEFISNMSHEIRTPMNGVIGFTNLLLETQLDPLQKDYVKTIQSSSQDLLAIINDILDYSKINSGKLQLDCIPLDIRACIDDVISLLAPNAHKKGLDLIPSTAIDVPKTVLGDSLRLKQIISNLISNAIKFTNHGYVLIRTKVERESDDAYHLCISVTDTGIGIAPDDQSLLFNAFNQADTSITRRYGGTGLGLVITKKLAEHMNGKITLTSELHKGTTCAVNITFSKLAAYEVERNQIHQYGHLKVLCFDENLLHLEALCNGLGCWGISCVKVESFNQLEKAFLLHSDCDLAFINVNQGCELQVGNILNKQSIPSVLLSKWLIQDYQSLGAKAFLFKPPNIQKIYRTIEQLINKKNSKQPKDNGDEALQSLRTKLKSLYPKLLLAEDNPVNMMLFHSLLNHQAYIITAEDGEEAFQKSRQEHFDAIILDLQMPKLDGVNAAKKIRRSTLNRTTPIIVISATSFDGTCKELKQAGVNIFLEKPIDEKRLITLLLEILDKNKAAIIDWSLCVKRTSGNKKLAREFLDRFIDELKDNRKTFINYQQQEDIKAIEALAHKLHGACCFCGVPDLQSHVAYLETSAKKAKKITELNGTLDKVYMHIDAVIETYNTHFKTEAIRI